ncbi:hypothetical protein MASR2M48_01090 [Spirochaetota bacterium]
MHFSIGRKAVVLAYAVAFTVVSSMPVNAQDVRIRVAPDLLIPVGQTRGDETFGLGGGGSLVMDMDIFGFLAPYLSGDIRYVAPAAKDFKGSLILASGGAGLGFFAFPLPRIKLGFSGGSGIYIGSYTGPEGDPTMSGNAFWRAGAEMGYRISPSLTLSASGSYVDFLTKTDSFSLLSG